MTVALRSGGRGFDPIVSFPYFDPVILTKIVIVWRKWGIDTKTKEQVLNH